MPMSILRYRRRRLFLPILSTIHHSVLVSLVVVLVVASCTSCSSFPLSYCNSVAFQFRPARSQPDRSRKAPLRTHQHPGLNRPRQHTMSSFLVTTSDASGSNGSGNRVIGEPHVENVLFIELGFGNDSHGQDVTKAAVRACRNAIEFNSIPSIQRLVPGGYDQLKLDVVLAVPPKYKSTLKIEACANVFPYGSIRFQIQDGGMIARSGIAIDRLGDKNDDMIVVCCSVTVGY